VHDQVGPLPEEQDRGEEEEGGDDGVVHYVFGLPRPLRLRSSSCSIWSGA
jgi:hypothetical protein